MLVTSKKDKNETEEKRKVDTYDITVKELQFESKAKVIDTFILH